jgi:hypothetical protein
MDAALVTLALAVCLCAIREAPAASAEGRPWEPFEVEMKAKADLADPYVQGLPEGGRPYVTVTFTGKSGEAKGQRYAIPGFWDGGRTWRARFAPPAPGEWSYLSASEDEGLRGVAGTLHCQAWSKEELAANPARHGFVRVTSSGPRAGRYFQYSDGRPFLWIGDTWWPWLKRGYNVARAHQVIGDRAARGFTVGQVIFGGNNGTYFLGRDYSVPDLQAIHEAEGFVAYAQSKGITLWIMPWWSSPELPGIGAEKLRRWSRYVVHRLCAYNVIWNVGGEYNMYGYGGMGLQFWKDMGALMRAEDPYQHAIGIHNTPPFWDAGEMGDSAQWSTGEVLHQEPWLDFNGSQTGHDKWRNELVPSVIAADYSRIPPKPTLITEPWYEFVEGNAPAQDVRFAAWSAILSGAAGHTYGGGHQWWADVPDPALPPTQDAWPRPPHTVDSLDFPGAVSVSFLSGFLQGLAWWELEPHPELVLEYAQPLAAAVPGREYVVYARYGGGLKLDLRAASAGTRFRYTWYDLTTSQVAGTGTVAGGAVRSFRSPAGGPPSGAYGDWLLHVEREPWRCYPGGQHKRLPA